MWTSKIFWASDVCSASDNIKASWVSASQRHWGEAGVKQFGKNNNESHLVLWNHLNSKQPVCSVWKPTAVPMASFTTAVLLRLRTAASQTQKPKTIFWPNLNRNKHTRWIRSSNSDYVPIVSLNKHKDLHISKKNWNVFNIFWKFARRIITAREWNTLSLSVWKTLLNPIV